MDSQLTFSPHSHSLSAAPEDSAYAEYPMTLHRRSSPLHVPRLPSLSRHSGTHIEKIDI
jgi:hypothetical protein